MLCGLWMASSGVSHAAEWRITPQVDLTETYSDNITLASDAAVASDDYITQVAPSIAIKGDGNRLKLDSSYRLQSLYYANSSKRNQTHNQLQLGANAELVEDLFYLSADGRLSQQLLTPGIGGAADNLNLDSGRGDVVTTQIQPRLKHRLGNYVEFDLSYSEGRVNYAGDVIADARLQDRKFSLERSGGPAKLDWQLNHSQSRQWAKEVLRSEREQSAASAQYAVFDRVSLIANGGKEDGQISSSRSYKGGTYWSAGLIWRLTPRLSLEAASGDNDRQGRLQWAPSARTSLSASYLDREVGVRARNAKTGTFNHSTRRTRWTLSYVEEITSNAVLAVVGSESVIMLDKSGEPIFDEFGDVEITQARQLGIVDEHFRRERSQGSFTFSARRNDITLGINSEQRHYELTDRQAQLHGGFLGWRLKLSARANSNVKYTVDRSNDSNFTNEIETATLTWSLRRSLGKRVSTGIELRATDVDGGVPNLSRSENRISANARVVF